MSRPTPQELEALVDMAMGMAEAWAWKVGQPQRASDLTGIACRALADALRTHDEAGGASRKTHARRRILGELLDATRAERKRLGRETLLDDLAGELGGFDDYSRRRIDQAMLTGIRIEARRKRIDWAVQCATADLLAAYRADSGDAPPDQLRALLHAVAAATFVVAAEEAQRGGEADVIARADYATAMEVIASVLAVMPGA